MSKIYFLSYGTDRNISLAYWNNCTCYHFCNNSIYIRRFCQQFHQAPQGVSHCRTCHFNSVGHFYCGIFFCRDCLYPRGSIVRTAALCLRILLLWINYGVPAFIHILLYHMQKVKKAKGLLSRHFVYSILLYSIGMCSLIQSSLWNRLSNGTTRTVHKRILYRPS